MSPKRPPPLWHWRCQACWLNLGLLALVLASFASLDLQWAKFLSFDALASMGRFVSELLVPQTAPIFLHKVLWASLETLAMSAVGTALAAVAGLALALPAAKTHAGDAARWRGPTRLLLNALRSIPELVWAALLLISAGLGPLAGTLALALHTTGVLGRLFAEAVENAPITAEASLREAGACSAVAFFYGMLPLVWPQVIAYSLYRLEMNIRMAAVLGFVGAGGLGQMLYFHLSIFQQAQAATVLIAMLLLVLAVDAVSHVLRGRLAG